MNEPWIVICEEKAKGKRRIVTTHGPFSDSLRAMTWAGQHMLDIAVGRKEVCPKAHSLTVESQPMRLERLP